ncbi:AraC family transcriptional regulator [Cupriavidus sp. CuC1]|uniref:AraC family transcriptional regulator n=1 Tax=Cupriavidus sp. CuC1 TaxID=3373131 RepID=UPI0037D06319
MALVSSTDLRLTHLRFPFAVRVDALHGAARLRDANARREVTPGNPFVVPAFAYFDCDLLPAPGQSTAITLQEVPDDACPRMTLATLPGCPCHSEKHWSRALAGEIFCLPGLPWNAALVAQRWEVTPRLVRARLFAEGEALGALLREQRVARAVYLLASGSGVRTEWLAAQVGLGRAAALTSACANTLGPAALRLLEGNDERGTSSGPAPRLHLAA